jgi:hypothetical protein
MPMLSGECTSTLLVTTLTDAHLLDLTVSFGTEDTTAMPHFFSYEEMGMWEGIVRGNEC